MSLVAFKKYFLCFALITLGFTTRAVQTQELTNDLARFERAGMVSEESVDFETIEPGGLGFTPETAAVPLFFDLDGNLLSAEAYNSLADEGELEQNILEVMYTDFSTFREVMEERLSLGLITQETLDTVDLNYVSGLPGSPVEGAEDPSTLESNAPGSVIYLYDPYQTSYQTAEEAEAAILEQMKRDEEAGLLEVPEPPAGEDYDEEVDSLSDPSSDD